MKDDIAITTVSWIRTEAEAGIVLPALTALSRLGVPVVVVDAGSPPQHQKTIRSLPHVIFSEKKDGLTSQIIASQQTAARYADFLLYLQSDKLDFALHNAPKMIEIYRALPKKGVLVPVRSQASLNTYPSYQREQEQFINDFMSDYIGIRTDYYAGPKIYPASLVQYLDRMQGDIGWGIEAFLYVIAKRTSLPFDFIPVQIKAPQDIDDTETTNRYRLRITAWQIEGYLQALQVPLIL